MTIQQPPDAEQRFGAAMTEIARRDLDVSLYDLGDGRYRCHLQRWGSSVECSAYSQLGALEGALRLLIERETKGGATMTGLTTQQRDAIREAVAGLARRQLVFLFDSDTSTLNLVRHMTNDILIELGTVENQQQLSQLAAYVSAYLSELYSEGGEDV